MSLQSWPGTECSARVGEMMMKTTLSAVLLGLGLAFSVPSFAAVNINTADQKALETLPGVGPAKAQAIIAHRPYKSKEDLKKVEDRKSVVKGKSVSVRVDLGGRRSLKKKKKSHKKTQT